MGMPSRLRLRGAGRLAADAFRPVRGNDTTRFGAPMHFKVYMKRNIWDRAQCERRLIVKEQSMDNEQNNGNGKTSRTVEISQFVVDQVASLMGPGDTWTTAFQRVLAKGLYGIKYQGISHERKTLRESIGKAIVKGGDLQDVSELVARLKATYKS